LATNNRNPNSNSLIQINNKTREYFGSLSWGKKCPDVGLVLGKQRFTTSFASLQFPWHRYSLQIDFDFRLPPLGAKNTRCSSSGLHMYLPRR